MKPLTATKSSCNAPRIKLLRHQWEELRDRKHKLIFVCGGRGSGKSFTDFAHFFLRSDKAVDQPYLLAANTDAQLHTFIQLIKQRLDEIGMREVFARHPPKKWRNRWRKEGKIVPAPRVRNLKFWIWEDGTHILCLTTVNSAYTRAKSLDIMFGIVEEATEPGVDEAAIDTLFGCIRCGVGEEECRRRNHDHQLIVKFNVPLNDPGHWVYRKTEQLQAKELKRGDEGKEPFFRLIESATRDNPHTGAYDARLQSAWDDRTYVEQTTGKLVRNTDALIYHSFSEQNILASLVYDPVRPLHIWFDFNVIPATSGWGHDLRLDEVPQSDLRSGVDYFGIIGELHSDSTAMFTEQVAAALLEDPSTDARDRCRETACGHPMGDHVEMPQGRLCRTCAFRRKDGTFCRAGAVEFEAPRRAIHAPANWRGLIRHRADIYVYADATGRNNDAGNSGPGGKIQILRDAFEENLGERIHFRIKDANPREVLRVLAVNSGLRARNGIHRIFCAPHCLEHISDFREVVPGPEGKIKKEHPTPAALKKGGGYYKRTHCTDGFGYMWDFRYPAVDLRASSIPSAGGHDSLGPRETSWPTP